MYKNRKKSTLFRIAANGCAIFKHYCENILSGVYGFYFCEKTMLTIFSPVALTIALTAWSFRVKIARSENSGKFLKNI